jgi:adenylate cyclase
MTEYSIGDVADRAGVANDDVVMLVELGILSSGPDGHFSEGDVRRVRLMKTLERAGMPLQGVAAAVQSGNLSLGFLDTAAYDRLASLSEVTLQEVSEKTGIPVELLMVIREAVGFAEPPAGGSPPRERAPDRPAGRGTDLRRVSPDGDRTLLRVYGDSLRRIAETEVDWWHTEVELPLLKSGMTPAEMIEAADSRVAQRIAPYLDQTILAMYHGHQEHTWMKSILDGIEATLSEAGVYSRLERPPAICFLDITGYTRLTEERGDEAAAELAGTLSRMVRRSSRAYGGKPVKWLGDGVMFFFPDSGSGVLAALDMVEGAANAGLPPAHVGLHAGPVLFQEGDYFGRTVNVAARIAEYARPGEVVVSQHVVEVVDAIPVSFVEIGPVELKGVSGALRLHTTRRDS